MAKVGSLIEKLFKKAGIDTTAENLKPLIALDAEISEEDFSKVDKGLLTLEAAKNNSEINKHFRNTILTGADARMDEMIVELGLQPGEDFVNDKNTYEKIAKLTRLANEAGKKATGKTSTDEFAKKEAEYNRQLSELKNSVTLKDKEIAAERTTGRKDNRLERKILSLADKLNVPAELDVDVKIEIVKGAINRQLQKEGLHLSLDDSDNLIVVDKDGKPAYNPKDNVAYEPNTYIDGALAQNKLLKINNTGDQHQQQQQQPGNNGAQFIPHTNSGNLAIAEELRQQRISLPA